MMKKTRKKELLEFIDNDIVLTPLVDEMVYLEKQLEDLRKLPKIKVNPRNKTQQRKTPAANLYKEFLPKSYKSEDVITYQWQQNREYNLKGHFNFYYNIARNSVSRSSMVLYLILLTVVGVVGNLIASLIGKLIGL